MFEGNTDIVFADINLSEAPIRGEPHNPGSGGWPTIRYFNKETGIDGGSYEKVTDLPMCSELLDRMHMIEYVESYSKKSLCALDGMNCSDKELAYVEKSKALDAEAQQAQLERLEVMTSKPMKTDLEEWAWRRMRILKKLLSTGQEEFKPKIEMEL